MKPSAVSTSEAARERANRRGGGRAHVARHADAVVEERGEARGVVAPARADEPAPRLRSARPAARIARLEAELAASADARSGRLPRPPAGPRRPAERAGW